MEILEGTYFLSSLTFSHLLPNMKLCVVLNPLGCCRLQGGAVGKAQSYSYIPSCLLARKKDQSADWIILGLVGVALPSRVSSCLTEEASLKLWHASELPGRQVRICVIGFALAFLLQQVWDRALTTFSIAAVLPMKPRRPSKNRNTPGQHPCRDGMGENTDAVSPGNIF